VALDLRFSFGRGVPVEMDALLPRLLSGVSESGSLRSAANSAGVSYRHAWETLRQWDDRFGRPLVALQRGRGASLTAVGELVLDIDRRARELLGPDLARVAASAREELVGEVEGSRRTVRIVASHGLDLAILREIFRRRTGMRMDLKHRGSIESLRILGREGADAAGFHIVNGPMRRRLAGRYRRVLGEDRFLLILVAERRQGLIVAPGNPRRIASVADLAGGGIRFVNRQADSGTRLLFDQLLAEAAIGADAIDGYETEEFTHLAVAAMVSSGAADAGFGIRAAASRFALEFVPLAAETYYFAVERGRTAETGIEALIESVAGEEFRGAVRALDGYDPSGSGMLVDPAEMLRDSGGG
jgi:molybdate transport repressor ModE-like protein